jgi:hypothetical protein
MSTIGLDTCLELVADRRRRRLIQHLRHEAIRETPIEAIVDRLTESELTAGKDSPRDREQLAIQVYHNDLPRLADHGVVAYDPARGTVRYEPDEQVEAVLDSIPGEVAAANP